MIEIATEQVIPLRRVPDYLERRGAKRPHLSAIYRWALAGLHGVRLETVRIGGVMHTSAQALDRWTKILTARGR